MKEHENNDPEGRAKKESKRTGFLHKLGQLAEAWEFDPQEALYLEVKALRNEVREIRQTIELGEK